jgi:hypothetical protein
MWSEETRWSTVRVVGLGVGAKEGLLTSVGRGDKESVRRILLRDLISPSSGSVGGVSSQYVYRGGSFAEVMENDGGGRSED